MLNNFTYLIQKKDIVTQLLGSTTMITEDSENVLVNKSFDDCHLPKPDPDTSSSDENNTNEYANQFSCSTPIHLGSKSCSNLINSSQKSHHMKTNLNSSLAEFEHYEQMAINGNQSLNKIASNNTARSNQSLNESQSTEYQSLLQAPIHQMEDLLYNLRSNYNKVPGQKQDISDKTSRDR
jgi:hypothetical protein